MHRRVIGILRDAWFLLPVILAAAVVFGWLISPGWGVAVAVLSLVVFVYFGIVRYDDDGNERSDTLH